MCPVPLPVQAPAGYVPAQALAFRTVDAPARFVAADTPLPVEPRMTAAAAVPPAGTAMATMLAGPFPPDLGRDTRLTLSGRWSGQVQLLRSTDGGATQLPLTIGGEELARFTANANEAVATESDAAATYYLSIALASGTLDYRVAQ